MVNMSVSTKIEELNIMLKELMKYNKESIKAFLELSASVHRRGVVDPKYKELIALALAVYRGCEHCIEYHMDQVIRLGALREEVIETLLVVLAMGGGTVSSNIVYALNALARLSGYEK